MATTHDVAATQGMSRAEKQVIFASSLGTVFEWYDFFLYGSLAVFIGKHFFAALDPTAQFIASLLAFAAGFIVRPFGALVFGRLGDMIGRKYTFLITILIMGLSTFVVGLLPSYASIGVAAPIILIALRILQGLAVGGEYGGAATYVAEHAPHGKRGAYTSWIQATATIGLILSLLVILGTRTHLGEATFAAWGWRIPFLLSILLLAISVWIRLSMDESPAFKRMQAEGTVSTAPVLESFGNWKNARIVLIALFGLVMGEGVVWYMGQFYSQFFLTSVLKVDAPAANIMVVASLVIGTPFYVIFGTWSDRIGRKRIIMLGLLLAVLTYFPLFRALTHAANPALAQAQASASITLKADPSTCSFQGNPVARDVDFTSGCDIAKRALTQSSAGYANEALSKGSTTIIAIGEHILMPPTATLSPDGHRFDEASIQTIASFKLELANALQAAGYPAKAQPIGFMSAQWWTVVGILSILVIYATMAYGPIAAMLVELFPTRIRYTSMSLPYHLGNGWFGGLLPSITFAMVAANGNMYFGLWYPVIIVAICFVVGMVFVRETKDVDIHALN